MNKRMNERTNSQPDTIAYVTMSPPPPQPELLHPIHSSRRYHAPRQTVTLVSRKHILNDISVSLLLTLTTRKYLLQ